MSLAAQLVVAGFTGKSLDDEGVRALIGRGLSRFVIFGRNVASPTQVAALLHGLASESPHPPLLCVDQEGGRVARLRAPLTVWPPMRMVGRTLDGALVEACGEALGTEIAALGFNVDFAPVADVNSHAANPVIGDRAFGDTPEQVCLSVGPFVRGLQRAGVGGCAKHFPGHGHVDADSHLVLPRCDLDADRLWTDHAGSFAPAIEAGVAGVMTAHVHYPAVDRSDPGTLSETLLQGWLRGRLGFKGCVFTDDLEMGALQAAGGIGEVAVRAVRAGCDAVLVCKDMERIDEVLKALDEAIQKDPAFAERCGEAAARIAALAARFPARTVSILAERAAVGRPEAQTLLARIESFVDGGHDPTERA